MNDSFKWILTENDFEKISWHDNYIYSTYYDHENFKLFIDIDYICRWIENNGEYSFEITPATLVFENVWDTEIDLFLDYGIIIDSIERLEPNEPKNKAYINKDLEWKWIINTIYGGHIVFKSVGFKLYLRRLPIITDGQKLNIHERGGISFYEGRNE